jgi:hypothetical protein
MLKAPWTKTRTPRSVCMCGTPEPQHADSFGSTYVNLVCPPLCPTLHAYLAGERTIQNGRTSSQASHPELATLPKPEAVRRPLSKQCKEKTRVTAFRWQKRGWEKGGGFRFCLLDRDKTPGRLHCM